MRGRFGWHNLAVDRHRRSRIAVVLPPLYQIATDGDVADRHALWDLVDRLLIRQRAAIYLHYRADLGYDDVAAILGITEGGARANVSRGLDSLRQRFGGRK
jgi:DNA-directed RNA polymerase specialized sigma24 family protein